MNEIETIPGQLDAIVTRQLLPVMQRLADGDKRMNDADLVRKEMSIKIDSTVTTLAAHDIKLDTIIAAQAESAKAMAENTAVTKTVNDALTTARVGRTVLIWVAGTAGAVVGIWGAIQTLWHH